MTKVSKVPKKWFNKLESSGILFRYLTLVTLVHFEL